MALTDQVLMPGSDYQAICNATRKLTGKTATLKSGDISTELGNVTTQGEIWVLNVTGDVWNGMDIEAPFCLRDGTEFTRITFSVANGLRYVKSDGSSVLVADVSSQPAQEDYRYEWINDPEFTVILCKTPPTGDFLTFLSGGTVPNAVKQSDNLIVQQIRSFSVAGSTADVTPEAPYDGMAKVRVTIPTVDQATPSIFVSSTGLITASATQSTGYVTSGTKTATRQLSVASASDVLNNFTLNFASLRGNRVRIELEFDSGTIGESGYSAGRFIKEDRVSVVDDSVTIPTEQTTITPSWTASSSSSSYDPTDGRLISRVVVNKPSTLISSNIKNGVEIGGITGTYTGDRVFVKDVSTINATTSEGVITFTTSSLARYLYAFVIRNGTKSFASADIRSVDSYYSTNDNYGLNITYTGGSYKYSWSIFSSENYNYDGANMTVYIINDL